MRHCEVRSNLSRAIARDEAISPASLRGTKQSLHYSKDCFVVPSRNDAQGSFNVYILISIIYHLLSNYLQYIELAYFQRHFQYELLELRQKLYSM